MILIYPCSSILFHGCLWWQNSYVHYKAANQPRIANDPLNACIGEHYKVYSNNGWLTHVVEIGKWKRQCSISFFVYFSSYFPIKLIFDISMTQ